MQTQVPGASSTSSTSGIEPYRVMVVDDSAVVRGLLSRILEEDPGIIVIASVGNGQMALNSLDRYDVEVVLLDIEMPVMDGMTALPKIIEKYPGTQVIMASILTHRNADISMRALEMGAADYIPKPSTTREITSGMDFKAELVGKVKALGAAARKAPKHPRPSSSAHVHRISEPLPKLSQTVYAGPIILRQPSSEIPDMIAVGSSTGGPQALFTLFGALSFNTIRQPIMVTQHMPATFTTILAEHITRLSGWQAGEGKDGEILRSGKIYVAPGDFHMVLEVKGNDKVIRLNKNPPENFCRPSVDPMFRSLSQIYGKKLLAIVLTGMGQDGMRGGQAVVAAGGTVIAQDEATSVVWGMPGAAATAGICSAVLPLPQIAPYVQKMAARN